MIFQEEIPMRRSKKTSVVLSLILFAVLIVTSGALSCASEEKKSELPQTNYVEGKSGTVTNEDVEQAKRFFIQIGLEEQDAKEHAVDHALKRESLYQAALENGYEVTDEEVNEYLKELKNSSKSEDNKEAFQYEINQFESEEDYWDFQFRIYKKNLPVIHYVENMEMKFFEDHPESGIDEWNEYFGEYEKQLVEDQHYEFPKE